MQDYDDFFTRVFLNSGDAYADFYYAGRQWRHVATEHMHSGKNGWTVLGKYLP